MVCIYCKNSTNISNSRHLSRSNGTWRRRNCSICGVTFSTIETPDYSSIWVVSRSGSKKLEPFNRNKLYISIYESLKHRNKAIKEADELTNTIINNIESNVIDGFIKLESIHDSVINVLNRFDNIASIHYKAYFAKN